MGTEVGAIGAAAATQQAGGLADIAVLMLKSIAASEQAIANMIEKQSQAIARDSNLGNVVDMKM